MKILTCITLLVSIAQVLCGQYFYSNGTKYYFSAPMKKNWYQAQRYCHANSMHLATVHTEEENRILLDLIYDKFQPREINDHFWTCGTNLGPSTNLDFYWHASGHSTLFTNWIANHPIENRSGAILLHGGAQRYQWFHELFNVPWYFICQDRLLVADASQKNMHFNGTFC